MVEKLALLDMFLSVQLIWFVFIHKQSILVDIYGQNHLLVINKFLSCKKDIHFNGQVHEVLVVPALLNGRFHIGHGVEVEDSVSTGPAAGRDTNGANLLVLAEQGILKGEIWNANRWLMFCS